MGASEVKERVRRIKRNETRTPRDLAKRFAELLALRELVRIREEQLKQRTLAKDKHWSLRRPAKKTGRLLRRPPA
jgi:hypothetical protein